MKKAFSMLEILIIIVIVGVISVIMITTIRPQDLQAGYLYINAHTFIKDAADNILLDAQNMEPAQDFPTNPTALCQAMAGYINSSRPVNCGASHPPYNSLRFDSNWTPSIVASNNMMLYFSSTRAINGGTHMLIWVDLNGERKPNTSTWKERAAADVVAFDVSSNGDVAIVGPPLFDTRYLWAKIHYSTDENGKGIFSQKMPFYQAQYRAFNGTQIPDDYYSIKLNDQMPAGSDLKAPASKMPTPTLTQYDRDMCGFTDGNNYSACTIKLSN